MRRTRVDAATALRRAPSKWYGAAVVGCAVFFAAMLISHPPIEGYQGLALVTSRSVAAPGAAPHRSVDVAAAEAWLRSDATISALAQMTDNGNLSAAGFELTQSGDGQQQQCTVSYVGRNRIEAAAAAQHAALLVAGYLDRAADARPSETELALLRERIESLQTVEDQLRSNIDDLRRQQLAGAVRLRDVQPTTPIESLPTGDHVKDVAAKIDQLRIESRTLSGNLTSAHPRVAAVNAEIAQLEQELHQFDARGRDSTLPRLPNDDDQVRSGGSHPSSAMFVATHGRMPQAAELTLAAQIDELAKRLRQALSDRRNVERSLTLAAQRASLPWVKQWSASQPTAVQRIGGTPRTTHLLWACLAGIAAAAAMALDFSKLFGGKTIENAAQARDWLAAPLLGQIALPETTAPRAIDSAVKVRVLRIAEWTLVVGACLLVVSAISQRDVAVQIASDPFGAMVEALDRCRSIVY